MSAAAARVRAPIGENIFEELWFGDDDPRRSHAEAANSAAAAVAKAVGLRPFPVAAAQVLQLLCRDDYDVRKVKRCLEADAGLTAHLMRVANSPFFRGRYPYDSIQVALTRLGSRNIQEILVSAVAIQMFDDTTGLGHEFLQHCAGVAAIARTLAKHWRYSGVDQLFLAGLLHDVGKLLCIQSGEVEYVTMPPEVLETPDTMHLKERELVGYDHAVLGGHVVREWGIPDPVPSVIAWHHQPGRAFQEGGQIGLMVALLRIADRIEVEIRSSAYQVLGDELAAHLATDEAMQFADVPVDQVACLWDLLVDAHREAMLMVR